MQFRVDTASSEPIYRQIAAQVRRGVAEGRLREGEKLPSVRGLSRELVVNPNTVARAYSELEAAGLLVTRRGLGVFVAAAGSDLTLAARRKRLDALVDALLVDALHLDLTLEDVQAAVRRRAGRLKWSRTDEEASP